MADPNPSVRLSKRRRIGKKSTALVEDDDSALDTAMYRQMTLSNASGSSQRKVLVPVRLEEQVRTDPDPGPEPELDTISRVADISEESSQPGRISKRQYFYMKEYVARANPILQALLAREALPEEQSCGVCTSPIAKWRCQDCTCSNVLCRSCMRKSHLHNPFHRIECWTGKFFRNAALWEVGVYLALPHHTGPAWCPNLAWQQRILEDIQRQKDLKDTWPRGPPVSTNMPHEPESVLMDPVRTPNPEQEAAQDAATMSLLDVLLQEQNGILEGDRVFDPDELLEEDDEEGQADAEADIDNVDAGAEGFVNYMRLNTTTTTASDQAIQDPGSESGQFPHGPLPPAQDALNNHYVRVIHTNGIHHIALVSCTCRGKETLIQDLIYSRMVPTSFDRIRTVFTMAVLDQFRQCNLEMMSSAFQFFQMLRRATMPLSPRKVVNFYHELRRLSHLWRWTKKLKWSGYGQHPGQAIEPGAGKLGIFCPACAQEGINLPEDWMADPNRWVFRRVFVADGNFKADHVWQRGAGDDIWLSNGTGMMTSPSQYEAFLKVAHERRTKAPCENSFRAIEQAMLCSKACDITGIAAIACARHGCFAPNSIVNLFRGEQQKNIDWALLEAIKTTNVHPRQGVTLHYDIMCQYIIYLMARIGHLLPVGLDIDGAIGLFHVHAHKEECLFRFASSFIPGAGVVAGEILESLWAGLNKITPATRTATLAHRAEIIDDHACDSNHKKAIGIAAVLADKFTQAKTMAQETTEYYNQMSSSVSQTLLKTWEREIQAAENLRGTNRSSMDILGAREVNPMQEEDAAQDRATGVARKWLRLALSIEERQIDIQDRVRRLKQEPREEDRQEVERLRQILAAEFLVLQTLANPHSTEESESGLDASEMDSSEFDDIDDVEEASGQGNYPTAGTGTDAGTGMMTEEDVGRPEQRRLPLPSKTSPDTHPWRKAELSIRIQQAARHLAAVKELVAEKSFQYSHVLRASRTNAVRTRSRAVIANLNNRIGVSCRIYGRTRAAMVRLRADEQTLTRFKILLKGDVKASTAILDPNIQGASSIRLSWIWQTRGGAAASTPETMREFQRVHWLRARAQKMRWAEEFTLIKYEMEWTTRYFLHKAGVWSDRSDNPIGFVGSKAYAARQAAQWRQLASEGERLYSSVNNRGRTVGGRLSAAIMSSKTIHLFNAYDLQPDPFEPERVNFQEVLDYCEARFRAALVVIIGEEHESQAWMMKTLFQELVCCFSYIGVAASIGRSVDIPILLRTLGRELYKDSFKLSQFTFGRDIITYLDGGLSGAGLSGADFWRPWWLGQNPPSKSMDFLGMATIGYALNHHRNVLKDLALGGVPPKINLEKGFQLEKSAYGWHSDCAGPAAQNLDCTRCRLYRAVGLGVYDQLRDLRNLAHGCETINIAERDLAERRASGLNLLYDAALMKETQAASEAEGKRMGRNLRKTWSKRGEDLRVAAAKAVEEWEMRPPMKWTWGVSLTQNDLQGLIRGADRNYQVPHSGYDASLKTGKKNGYDSDSPDPADIVDDWMVSELSKDFPVIRDLEPYEIPLAFACPTLQAHSREILAQPGDAAPESTTNSESDSVRILKQKDKGKQRAHGERSSVPWLHLPPEGYIQPPRNEVLISVTQQLETEPQTAPAFPSSAAGLTAPVPVPESGISGSPARHGPGIMHLEIDLVGLPGSSVMTSIFVSSEEESPVEDEAMEISDEGLDAEGAGMGAGANVDYLPMSIASPGPDEKDSDLLLPMVRDVSDLLDDFGVDSGNLLPMDLVMEDSDEGELDEEVEEDGSPHQLRSHLTKGPYTPASFVQFQDDWVD